MTSCSICLELYKEEDTLKSTCCGHIFHENCISEWRKRSQTCPQCNAKITKLLKVFLSFASDWDSNSAEHDKEMDIALLSSKMTALEKSENDMKVTLLNEQSKVHSQKDVIKCLKKEIQVLKTNIQTDIRSKDELKMLRKESLKMEKELNKRIEKLEAESRNGDVEKKRLLNELKLLKSECQQMETDYATSNKSLEFTLFMAHAEMEGLKIQLIKSKTIVQKLEANRKKSDEAYENLNIAMEKVSRKYDKEVAINDSVYSQLISTQRNCQYLQEKCNIIQRKTSGSATYFWTGVVCCILLKYIMAKVY